MLFLATDFFFTHGLWSWLLIAGFLLPETQACALTWSQTMSHIGWAALVF